MRGASAQVRVENFPSPGEVTLFEWEQSTQHLEMVQGPELETVEPVDVPEDFIPFLGTWVGTGDFVMDYRGGSYPDFGRGLHEARDACYIDDGNNFVTSATYKFYWNSEQEDAVLEYGGSYSARKCQPRYVDSFDSDSRLSGLGMSDIIDKIPYPIWFMRDSKSYGGRSSFLRLFIGFRLLDDNHMEVGNFALYKGSPWPEAEWRLTDFGVYATARRIEE